MLRNCKAEINIRKVDNGFILEWEQEKPTRQKYRNAVSQFDDDELSWKNPSGVELFMDYKSLEKRVKELL